MSSQKSHPAPLKGHYVDAGEEIQTQKCNIYNVNEVIIQTQKYTFFLYVNKQALWWQA